MCDECSPCSALFQETVALIVLFLHVNDGIDQFLDLIEIDTVI